MPKMGLLTLHDSSVLTPLWNQDASGVEGRFEVHWSRGGADSAYFYKDAPSINAVAIAEGATEVTDIFDAARFDFSSRAISARAGQIVLLKNNFENYAALKILSIRSLGFGSHYDELRLEFTILEGRGRDFSQVSSSPSVQVSHAKHVVLMGAGFSRNWGGLLASEIKEFIVKHPSVRERPRAEKLIAEQESFEDALEIVRTGLYQAEDEAAVQRAIQDAFAVMDQRYCQPDAVAAAKALSQFLAKFCSGDAGGFLFTLNQDLLIERLYDPPDKTFQLALPGLAWRGEAPRFPGGSAEMPIGNTINPFEGAPPNVAGQFNLIKLHGSINWRSESESPSLVMGRNKVMAISANSLLVWYHRLFERVINAKDVSLMTIGYGWRDEHINNLIARAVGNGLRVFDWNVVEATSHLHSMPHGSQILRGLFGTSIEPVKSVISTNAPTNEYDRISATFFEIISEKGVDYLE